MLLQILKGVVKLIDFYIAKLLPDPPGFYLRPLDKVPGETKPGTDKTRNGK